MIMQPPFIPVDPSPSYLLDLNKVFATYTGKWKFHPAAGYACMVPAGLADAYCETLNGIAGKPVASRGAVESIAAAKSGGMAEIEAARLTLDPAMLADTKLLDLLEKAENARALKTVHGEWASNAANLRAAAAFPFGSSGRAK